MQSECHKRILKHNIFLIQDHSTKAEPNKIFLVNSAFILSNTQKLAIKNQTYSLQCFWVKYFVLALLCPPSFLPSVQIFLIAVICFIRSLILQFVYQQLWGHGIFFLLYQILLCLGRPHALLALEQGPFPTVL